MIAVRYTYTQYWNVRPVARTFFSAICIAAVVTFCLHE